jgi:hypothetical protein
MEGDVTLRGEPGKTVLLERPTTETGAGATCPPERNYGTHMEIVLIRIFCVSCPGIFFIEMDTTREEKKKRHRTTGQDEIRQDTTSQDNHKARQGKGRQDKTRHGTPVQGKVR